MIIGPGIIQLPVPSRSHTPPTPPVPAASPPASTRPLRQRAMAQLRPVSTPEIVRDPILSVLQLLHSLCSALQIC